MNAAAHVNTWQCVESPLTAKLLTDVDELNMLKPFFVPCTVKAAADTLGVPLDVLYYRVRRARKLGLLRVASTQPRAGRAIKRYVLCADGFFVPSRVATGSDLQSLLVGLQKPLEHLLNRNLLASAHSDPQARGFGLRVYRDEAGSLVIDAAHGPHEPYEFLAAHNPATFTAWNQLKLDFDDAKALQQDLQDLWLKYARKRGGQRYLLRLAMAPLLEQ